MVRAAFILQIRTGI